jgi:hypothetical protein
MGNLFGFPLSLFALRSFVKMYLGEVYNRKECDVWKKIDFICMFKIVCIRFSFGIRDQVAH